MQSLYLNTRRVISVLLAVALVIYAGLGVFPEWDLRSAITVGSAVTAIVLLLAVICSPRARVAVETVSFLAAAIATAVCWGASRLGSDLLLFLPALVVAIAYATIALTLRATKEASRMEDRP